MLFNLTSNRPAHQAVYPSGEIRVDANQDLLQSRWPEFKGQVRQQWGKLTVDDLARLSGKTEGLACVLRQQYGYGKVQAEMEIDNWLRGSGRSSDQR